MDENLRWIEHIKYKQNKLVKNVGLLDKAKHYLNKRSQLFVYYSFIHTYINYGNIAWEVPIEQIFKKSTVCKNTPSESYIVKTESHMRECRFKKAKF